MSHAAIINLALRVPRVSGKVATGLAMLLACAGCVDIDGGAIEASWVLRTFDGRAVGGECACSRPGVTRVRFVVREVAADGTPSGPDVCAGRQGCDFTCASQRGATPFFVPPGRYAISLAPLGGDGAALPTGDQAGFVRVQAPILRDVSYGKPTQLDAFAIEVGCSQACDGGLVTRACEKD